MKMSELFRLFGQKANKVIDTLKAGKTIKYVATSVEGRTVLKVMVEE